MFDAYLAAVLADAAMAGFGWLVLFWKPAANRR
jgi:hypothetical protein